MTCLQLVSQINIRLLILIIMRLFLMKERKEKGKLFNLLPSLADIDNVYEKIFIKSANYRVYFNFKTFSFMKFIKAVAPLKSFTLLCEMQIQYLFIAISLVKNNLNIFFFLIYSRIAHTNPFELRNIFHT